MISWLQIAIQKHNKWLFSVLLVIIIMSFVFTIGNTGGVAGPGGNYRQEFYGYDINPNSRDRRELDRLNYVSLSMDGRQANQYIFEISLRSRIIMLHLADELNVPSPTQEQLGEFIQSKNAFINPADGKFSNDLYTEFLDTWKDNEQINENTVGLVLAQDYRIDQVKKAVAGPGYVVPHQAVEDVKRQKTEWTIQVAEIDESKNKPQTSEITVEEAALAEYFENNKNNYKSAEQMVSSYVEFSVDDFLPQITDEPTDADLQTVYTRQKYNYRKDDETKTIKTFAEAKDLVIADWKKEQAIPLAAQAATQLTVSIYEAEYDEKIKSGDSAALKTFLTEAGHTVTAIPAYAANKLPTDSIIPSQALRDAFSIKEDRIYSDAIETANGAVVMIYEDIIASQVPPFEEVEVRVTVDYKRSEADRLYTEKLDSLKAELEESLTAEGGFKAKAEALELTVQNYEKFTLLSPPDGLDTSLFRAFFEKAVGDVTDPVLQRGKASVVYVAAKDIPEIATDSDELDQTMEQLSLVATNYSEQAMLMDLIRIGSPAPETEE